MSSDIVRLNVGGRLFVTSVATLTCRGSSFFTGLLSGRMPSVRDESGAYFIDRSADCFAPILEFMRTGKLRLPPGMEASAIQDEADFYQVTLPRATTATYGWVHLKSNYQNSYTYVQCSPQNLLSPTSRNATQTLLTDKFVQTMEELNTHTDWRILTITTSANKYFEFVDIFLVKW